MEVERIKVTEEIERKDLEMGKENSNKQQQRETEGNAMCGTR